MSASNKEDDPDWRDQILKALNELFLNENSNLLTELRAFAINQSDLKNNVVISDLEAKINNQVIILINFKE